MRPLLFLALLALLLPLAAARPDLPEVGDLRNGRVPVGPCLVGWSMYWPGENVGLRCETGGVLVAFSYGSCALGHYVYVQVNRLYAHLPCDWRNAAA